MQLNQIHKYKIAGYLLLPAAHSASIIQTKSAWGAREGCAGAEVWLWRVGSCVEKGELRDQG